MRDEIELHFVSDGQVITSQISAVEKFQFGISLGLAKYYSDAISDNVRRAIEQKIRKGEWVAKAPYGYKNIRVGDKKDILLDEYEAQIARKAFELYATGAFSMALLCEKLKREYGIDWTVSYIDKLFDNPFYYGFMCIKDKLYPHRYPPVIHKTLFDEVQRVKNSFNKKRRFKLAGQPYIYRGMVRCARCDLAITPEKHKGIVYYHCTQSKGKHDATWFREEKLTQQMEELFKSFQMSPETLEEMVTTLNKVHEDKVVFQTQQYDKLMREQKSLTKIMDNLYMDKLKGSITESE